jgi:hypothetical protein
MKQLMVFIMIICLAPLATAAAETEEMPELPEKFTATLMVVNNPVGRSGMERISLVVESWTTDEERGALFAAMSDGGIKQLVKAMQDLDVGYLQIGQSLGWRLRTAATWQTEEGRTVRLTTDRPMHFQEQYQGTQSRDYPVGIIEFVLPPEGKGEGVLLAATKVQVDDQGQIEVKSLPYNTGPQKLTLVEKVVPKKKKKKKKKKSEDE